MVPRSILDEFKITPSTGDARYGSQVIINFSDRPRLARYMDINAIVEGKENKNTEC